MSDPVLLVDADLAARRRAETHLIDSGAHVVPAASLAQGRAELERREFAVVLTDLNLADGSGLDLCRWISENRLATPAIVTSSPGSVEDAIGAMRVGAFDFLRKPVEPELLQHAVRRAQKHAELHREVERLRAVDGRRRGESGLVGESEPMRELADLIARFSLSEASVLVTGESGTGKELIARSLHEQGSRRAGPFVALNCVAVPENLLESELFGHVRGAFTDAHQSRDGLLCAAQGGTLFLDEIGEMPVEMQVKLLRALQERRVRPVGGQGERQFDTRIIAATNRDIEREVKEGRFREDLYYRINVLRLHAPPLSARGSDVLLLADHFLRLVAERVNKHVTGFTPAAAERLLDYPWPGNVRELENVIERAVALTRFDTVTVDDLPERVRMHRSERLNLAAEDPEHMFTLEDLEERYIRRVLAAVGGNKTHAARVLGLDRRTLYRKLDRYAVRDRGALYEADDMR